MHPRARLPRALVLLAAVLGPLLPGAAVDPAGPEPALDLITLPRRQPARAFQAGTLANGTIRLDDLKGQVVFLNFWATWCGPCKEEMPAMERLYRRFKDRGLAVVALSVDPEPSAVAPFVREHKLSFAIGLDPRMSVASLYGVRALPSTFIIDRRGILSSLALGPREWDSRAAHAFFESLLR
ncbi:MAG: TlpA family protein disulfide reductase [Candidatus Rokubacteria bacterium]|nr:TlpA family protein disulfide reductase [Candidatus Rokubacteria bacterium]